MALHVESRRLSLRSLSVPVMEALLAGDRVGAGSLLECHISDDVVLKELPLAMRLEQVQRDPSVQPWLLRAMIDRDSRMFVGHIGFHTAPRPEYLAAIAPNAVELGYSVHEPGFCDRSGARPDALGVLAAWPTLLFPIDLTAERGFHEHGAGARFCLLWFAHR